MGKITNDTLELLDASKKALELFRNFQHVPLDEIFKAYKRLKKAIEQIERGMSDDLGDFK